MNDVRQKKIKCIVVKDLSRFGRNYLEAGYYIETVFPFLGIRLIAVTDNFDSTRKEDMESLALPIRNMVNAMYAKDISKKIWTSLQRKKEAGYAVGNDAPYGYIRNPVTKRNEIDPEAAFYVQLIFQWELMGVPIFEIARRMTLLQVPTPREWHRKMVEGKEVLTCKKWGVTTIRHILENQTYVGDTINNKSTQKLFAGQDKRDLPKEQWYVAKNTHPAIIARDDFEKVQKILDKNGQQNGRKEDIMKAIRWLLKLVLVMITLPLILAVWLAKWFVVFLHHCSAWFFYLLGSVLLVTAMLSFLMQQSQGMEALQMLIGGFVIFMIPQVVGSVIVLLELAAVMLRQAWYI